MKVVETWEEKARKMKGTKVANEVVRDDTEEIDGENDDGSGSEWEDEVEEAPRLVDRKMRIKKEEEVDEDGFTTVVKGKNSSHR